MICKVNLILCLALCVSGSSHERPAISEQKIQRFYEFTGHHGDLAHIGHHEPEHHEAYAWAYPSYEFSYYVDDPHTHDHKGQHEIRDGDKVTGKYWLIQPDGYKRVVNYHADHKSGFHADVKYLPVGHHFEVNEHHHHHGHHEEHAPINEYKHAKKREDRVGSQSEKLEDWNKRHRDELYGKEYSHLWARHRKHSGRDDDWEGNRDEIRGDDYSLGYDERRIHAHRKPEEKRSEESIREVKEDEHTVKHENRGHEDHLWGTRGWVKEHLDHKYDSRKGLKYENRRPEERRSEERRSEERRPEENLRDGKENEHTVKHENRGHEDHLWRTRGWEKERLDHKYDSRKGLKYENRKPEERRSEERRPEENLRDGKENDHTVKHENRGHEDHLWGTRDWAKERLDHKYDSRKELKYEIKLYDDMEDKHRVNDKHHGHEGYLYGMRRFEKKQPDRKKEHHDEGRDEGRGRGPANKEHWKHGVLVGWNEGKGLDDDDKPEYEHHSGIKVRPNYKFKPLIPYGLGPRSK